MADQNISQLELDKAHSFSVKSGAAPIDSLVTEDFINYSIN